MARLAVLVIAMTVPAAPAGAEFRVRSPDVELGVVEVEHFASLGFDRSAARTGEQSYVGEVAYGVTSFWKTEVEGEFGRDPGPGNRTRFGAGTWENLFQFTERGEYWADFGFFAEYSHAFPRGAVDQVTFGPLIRKEIGGTINVLNLFLQKELGAGASGRPQFLYAWQTRLALGTWIEPGIEVFGQPGAFGHFAALRDQDHRAGPVVYGTVREIGPGRLNFEAGYLYGLTRAAPQNTLKWGLEYEFHF